MHKSFRKNALIIGIPLIILLLTNPSIKSFKEYLGLSSSDGLQKRNQFFIASMFSYDNEMYLGLFGNFFKVSRHNTETSYHNYSDSTAIKVDSSDATTATIDTILIAPSKRTTLDKALEKINKSY